MDLSASLITMVRQIAVPAPGRRFTPDIEDRLTEIDQAAARHVRAIRPANTSKGYRGDWTTWLRYCAETDLPPAVVTTGTLVLFVEWAWLQPGWKAGTFKAPSNMYRLTLDRRVAVEARILLKAKTKASRRDR
jgi:hypothetical protein